MSILKRVHCITNGSKLHLFYHVLHCSVVVCDNPLVSSCQRAENDFCFIEYPIYIPRRYIIKYKNAASFSLLISSVNACKRKYIVCTKEDWAIWMYWTVYVCLNKRKKNYAIRMKQRLSCDRCKICSSIWFSHYLNFSCLFDCAIVGAGRFLIHS